MGYSFTFDRPMADDYSTKHGRVPLQHGPIYLDITYDTAMTATEPRSELKLTTDTP